MATSTKGQKLQQIITHFVGSNQKLGTQITAAIAKAKSQRNPGPGHIIAQFTSDPVVTGQIKNMIAKVRAGHSIQSLVGYHIADPQKAQAGADSVQLHKGAIKQILAG